MHGQLAAPFVAARKGDKPFRAEPLYTRGLRLGRTGTETYNAGVLFGVDNPESWIQVTVREAKGNALLEVVAACSS